MNVQNRWKVAVLALAALFLGCLGQPEDTGRAVQAGGNHGVIDLGVFTRGIAIIVTGDTTLRCPTGLMPGTSCQATYYNRMNCRNAAPRTALTLRAEGWLVQSTQWSSERINWPGLAWARLRAGFSWEDPPELQWNVFLPRKRRWASAYRNLGAGAGCSTLMEVLLESRNEFTIPYLAPGAVPTQTTLPDSSSFSHAALFAGPIGQEWLIMSAGTLAGRRYLYDRFTDPTHGFYRAADEYGSTFPSYPTCYMVGIPQEIRADLDHAGTITPRSVDLTLSRELSENDLECD